MPRRPQPKRASRLRGAHGLGAIQTVQSFRQTINSAGQLSTSQRKRLIQQARVLIEDLYVHLPLKRAMHAVDPIQRLRLLDQRLQSLTVVEFNHELLDIFTDLRDLHTNFTLPAPFDRQIAFLGILIEKYVDNGADRWLVSKIAEHLVSDAMLKPGVEITHWNAMPIEVAVRRNAEKEAGSNIAAQMARGLETLTLRFMRASAAPDEDWVTITYLANGALRESRLDWQVFDSVADLTGGAADPAGILSDLRVPLRYQIGVDETRERLRKARKQLFNRSAVKEASRVRRYKGRVPRHTAALQQANVLPTTRPDEITPRLVTTPSGTFGYMRLWTFHMQDNDIDAFINEFIRLLQTMPPEGLMIDVRGNGGGFIIAAEFLLQMLTPNHIAPEPTQFVATEATLALVNQVPSMAAWRPSLAQAVSTGAAFSAGIPLSPEELVNRIGQRYFGPVVLITDAYCYSACDMFAAGFQDHDIGWILGVDPVTGAGGANVLTHEALRNDWNGGPLQPLPGGAGMRVSLRRTLRVGARSGEPVEDLGVSPDELHQMTRADLMNGNVNLLARAGELLANGIPRRFDLQASSTGNQLQLQLQTLNVESVDLFLDDRPLLPRQAISDGANNLAIPMPTSGSVVQIDGYETSNLVCSRKVII